MLVVLANNLPPAVRDRMKLWFVEPRPNVFVSGIKNSVAQTVVEYLYQHCKEEAGVIMFRSLSKPPGYEIRYIGGITRGGMNPGARGMKNSELTHRMTRDAGELIGIASTSENAAEFCELMAKIARFLEDREEIAQLLECAAADYRETAHSCRESVNTARFATSPSVGEVS